MALPSVKSDLHEESKNGEIRMVRRWLNRGTPVNARKEGYTALHLASKYGHEDIARLLIENGADVHQKSFGEYMAIHYACQAGNLSTVELLVEHGANIYATVVGGKTVEQLALEAGHDHIVRYLKQYKKDHPNVSSTFSPPPAIPRVNPNLSSTPLSSSTNSAASSKGNSTLPLGINLTPASVSLDSQTSLTHSMNDLPNRESTTTSLSGGDHTGQGQNNDQLGKENSVIVAERGANPYLYTTTPVLRFPPSSKSSSSLHTYKSKSEKGPGFLFGSAGRGRGSEIAGRPEGGGEGGAEGGDGGGLGGSSGGGGGGARTTDPGPNSLRIASPLRRSTKSMYSPSASSPSLNPSRVVSSSAASTTMSSTAQTLPKKKSLAVSEGDKDNSGPIGEKSPRNKQMRRSVSFSNLEDAMAREKNPSILNGDGSFPSPEHRPKRLCSVM